MKNKPVSHKNDNTFRFTSFAERLNRISIDVIHRVGKTSENPEDANTFLQEAVEKWNDLNYTEDYESLRREIGYEISTLNQVVYRQNELVDILLRHLQKPESMSLDAALEFVVALARDLQFDFYPSFPKFFVTLTHLLETRDTELLEKIFTSLSYLFKFLWRYMLKDMENVYRLYSCLLTTNNKEHIRKFAAESFAFLIRKVQDKPKLFNVMFHHLEANPEIADGLGQLMFEAVKGIKQHLHSCSKLILQLLLQCLGEGLQNTTELGESIKLPYSLVEKTVLQMLAAVQKHTLPIHAVVVEETFYEVLMDLWKNYKSSITVKEDFTNHLYHILKLLCFWVQYRDAKFVTKSAGILEVLNSLFGFNELPDNCVELLMELTAVLLLSKNIDVPLTYINKLLNYIYESKSKNLVFQFTRKMFDYGMLEKDILPRLVNYCTNIVMVSPSEFGVLQMLAETVIHMRPLPQSWEDVKCFSKLQLQSLTRTEVKDYPKADENKTIESCLLKILESAKESVTYDMFDEIFLSFVCLPHFKSLDVDFTQKLVECVSKACSTYLDNVAATKDDNGNEVMASSLLLYEALICWLCLGGKLESSEHFTFEFFTNLFMKFPSCVNVLRMMEVCFNCIDAMKIIDAAALHVLMLKLVKNLASPFHQVRLHTLRVLCLLPCTLPTNDDGVSEEYSVFYICWQAEKVLATVESYRDKLKWLRKLEFPFIKKHIPTELQDDGLKVPIHYLLGCLYINFSLMWQPVLELVSTFAHGCSNEFWNVFQLHLHEVIDLVEKSKIHDDYSNKSEVNVLDEDSLLTKWLKTFCKHVECPDIQNHRLLLWKSVSHFPGVARQHDNDIVTLLFRFVEKEVIKVDTSLATSEAVLCDTKCDIIQEDLDDGDADSEAEGCSEEEDDDDDDDDDCSPTLKKPKLSHSLCTDPDTSMNFQPEELSKSPSLVKHSVVKTGTSQLTNGNQKKRKKTKNIGFKRHHVVVKTLGAILSLFTKFKKPSSLHRTDELQKLYYELLSYQDGEIQKLAFDCIAAYNFSFLTPYKQHFYNILDDKTFKSEIVLFNIDKENEVIQEDHRMDALAVLMRILYGKMHRKTGNNTSGKAQAHTRKMLVLRFLSGCRAEELKMFFNLVFDPLKEKLNGDALTAVKLVRETLDLSSIIPIRKLRSSLNTVEVILHNLGSLVPELLPWFLKVVLVVAATSSALLEKQNELLPYCIKLIKLVRRNAVMQLIKFFKLFDHYHFSSNEIDAIFEAIVWPALPRLEFEALTQPPPLLRLFDTWCSNSRYFTLLGKCHHSSKTLSPISHIMSLYIAQNARPRVIGLLSKMFHSLLTLSDYQKTEDKMEAEEIQANNYLSTSEFLKDDKETHSLGMQLLFPYVDILMKRIQIIVSRASKNRNRSLNSRELTILLKISTYIEESETCRQLIELLVPFFMHQKKLNSDCEVLVLSTVNNLIKKVTSVQSFLKLFAPLFGVLSSQRSRMALVTIFTTMGEKDAELQRIVNIVQKINAWNPDIMGEPDYEMRVDGHKEALAFIDEMAENIDDVFIPIIIFNSSFMIQKCDDLSLRNSSSYLLQQLVQKLSKVQEMLKPTVFKYFIFDTLLPEVRRGLKSKTEVVRFEFICILAALLHSCGSHTHLSDLAQLCDKDKEADFWENIRHLQVHRRVNALLKLTSKLNSGDIKIHSNSLVSYIIPIVSSFFFDNAYSKRVHVIDIAIDALGAVVRHLPWSHYESILRYYLNCLSKTDHHKTVVKIIVSLLNAFHFDLSASRGIFSNLKEPPVKEKANKGEVISGQQDDSCAPNLDAVTVEEAENGDQGEKKGILNEDKATKIHYTIAKDILPQLHRSLMHKMKGDDEHKLAGNYHPEDEDILRVPIALAIVKLLQNLPHESLEKNLPGLFLKMCQLLKSKTQSIRETARDTLVKMMQSLGPKYLWYLINEMRGVMKRGYQVHVMTYTINAILQNIKSQFKSGDLDTSISNLTQVCMNELFGETAEEKEVAKIIGKLKEARSNRSYAIYEILSQFISEGYLSDLISPLKNVLSTTRSHKAVKKIQECLRHIALGISENTGVTVKVELIFIYSLISENFPLAFHKSKSVQVSDEKKYVRPDIYLIPDEPGRSGPPAKTGLKTNMHVLIDFSLQLLQFCLRRGKLKPSVQEHLEMVDPFINILCDCLDCNHIKIISTALRCLLWLFKFLLPSLKIKATHIINSTFVLLNKYAGVGMGQGENFEMVVMCFKVVTVVVRDTNYHQLSDEQLRVLLSYIEQDIHDHTRQATAFSLLKAILSKKLQAAELNDIMNKISEMAITSEQDHIRTQCRQVSLQYMSNYLSGKNFQNSLSFYVNQLEYLHEHGRISSIEMIKSILNSFSPGLINKHAGLLLVPLAARLVNDESSKCRKMAAATIKNLLMKVDHDERRNLFSIALTWMENKKASHRRLGAQLCGIFYEVDGQNFEHIFGDVLPLVISQLEEVKSKEVENPTDVRCQDHFLYHLLSAFTKILKNCNIIKNDKFAVEMNAFWEHVQQLILYPHLWVRVAASQLFGCLYSSYTIEEVIEALNSNEDHSTIFFASRQKLRDMSADFATQLQSPYLNEVLGEQVTKNLVYITKVISKLPEIKDSSSDFLEEEEENVQNGGEKEKVIEVTLSWIIRKLSREANKEVAYSPQNSIKRKCIFTFLAAVAHELDEDKLIFLLPNMLFPLCRELSDSSPHADESLKSLARNVLNMFKDTIGVECFTKVYAVVQSHLVKKKLKRKQDKIKEAVTNPEKFAKKKIKKQQNKKEAKKRKILKLKGKKKKSKKMKLSNLAIES